MLVVEDELLVAMDLELLLQRHGWRVLGPATTRGRGAPVAGEGQTPDVALLDVNLQGELVTPVAEQLRARGVPFVVASAYRDPGRMAAALAGAPAVGKPVDERRLISVLAQAVPPN